MPSSHRALMPTTCHECTLNARWLDLFMRPDAQDSELSSEWAAANLYKICPFPGCEDCDVLSLTESRAALNERALEGHCGGMAARRR
jgi:hypothetical protein